MRRFGKGVASVLAGGSACAATDAFAGIIKQLVRCLVRLGIVAPDAAQGATLEKDGGADAGTVVDREFLNVKNVSCHGLFLVQ
jgi:hypothetical protein